MALEQLLNGLLKRGWKPFNVNCAWTNVEVINRLREDDYYIPEHTKIIFKTETHWHVFDCNIRDLVSKSSGLWQFCAKNKLVNVGKTYIMAYTKRFRDVYELKKDEADEYSDTEYEYWLIESALRDVSELEQFLLDNIKIS